MKKTALALGFFDGVHKGHAKIIETAVAKARERGLTPVCLTFDTHPRALISGEPPELITSLEEKERLIKNLGAEKLIYFPFNEKTAEMSPHDFAAFLKEELFCGAAVCGESFRFGKNAAGKPSDIEKAGIPAIVCDEVRLFGQTVSSTLIRRLLKSGDIKKANEALGRAFSITGEVKKGRGVGRTLLCPTANIIPQKGFILPSRGVYATRVKTPAGEYGAVTDIGTHPTFNDDNSLTVESLLFDFSGDLYGQRVTVSFYEKIRDEIKFKDEMALKARIEKDIIAAQTILKGEEQK